MGAILSKVVEMAQGHLGSLMNSVFASVNGWRIPYDPTMLDPFHSCM